MQNQSPNPSAQPPPVPTPVTPENRLRDDFQAMEKTPTLLSTAEALLRNPGQVLFELKGKRATRVTFSLLMVSVLCLLAYGATVGMFSWDRQIWVAPVKITVGILGSALICLPSLVIFSCLSGSRTSVGETSRIMVGALALIALLLVGFAPVSWIFSQSTESVVFMGFLSLIFWGIGVFYGLRFLTSCTRFVNGKQTQHMAVWGFIFVLVCLQMTSTLRPIVGTSERLIQPEKKFFLTHWGETLSKDVD